MGTNSIDYFLYADDDIDDHILLTEILNENLPGFDVKTCYNGMEVLQFLEELPPGAHLPCCIILDINMPVWSGVQTLQVLKAHERFSRIPVVMFTTSSAQRDIDLSMLIEQLHLLPSHSAIHNLKPFHGLSFRFAGTTPDNLLRVAWQYVSIVVNYNWI